MINIKNIEECHKKIKPYVKKTELLWAEKLSRDTKSDIYLKLENLQKSGSFKIRGACNKILGLSKEEISKGIIAASAGNHAQGVAAICKDINAKSLIVMPENAPKAKVESTKNYGASVVLKGENYDGAYKHAQKLQEEEGYTFVHAFNDEEIILGQATVGLELLEQLEDFDQVIVPAGGGGLIAGIAIAIKSKRPEVKIIGVQTENAQPLLKSFRGKELISETTKGTIADGINVGTPGALPFKYIEKYVDEFVTVSEKEIAQSILYLLRKCKVVAEGAGAVTVAAVRSNKINLLDKKTICIVSGGNIDMHILKKIIEEEDI